MSVARINSILSPWDAYFKVYKSKVLLYVYLTMIFRESSDPFEKYILIN